MLVQNTIGLLDNHILNTCFPIFSSIFCSTYLLELEGDVALEIKIEKDDSGLCYDQYLMYYKWFAYEQQMLRFLPYNSMISYTICFPHI